MAPAKPKSKPKAKTPPAGEPRLGSGAGAEPAPAKAKALDVPLLVRRPRPTSPQKRGPKPNPNKPAPERSGPFTVHTALTGRLSYRLRAVLTLYPHRHPKLVTLLQAAFDQAQAMRAKGVRVDFATLVVDMLSRALEHGGWQEAEAAPAELDAPSPPAVITGAVEMGDEI